MTKPGKEKQNQAMLLAMYLLCFLTVFLIAAFVCLSTDRICRFYEARAFLDQIRYIPHAPFQTLIKAEGCMLLLGLSCVLRLLFGQRIRSMIPLSLAADFVLAFLVIYLLNFNYNGVLLWVFANVLSYANNLSFPVIGIGILSYLFTDHELMELGRGLYSVSDYIGLYSSAYQPYLFGVYHMLEILSIVCFIGCCLLAIISKEEKLEEINELYAKLSRANADLKQANEELSDIMEQNTKMAEVRERNRIAREIHDTMGHTLTGITAGIDACIALSDSAPELVKPQLQVLAEVSRKGISDVRHSMNELRPDALERLNLEAAIRQLVEDTVRVTGARVNFSCTAGVLKFDEDEESAIYRVIQESITNALRHGHATQIDVAISRRDNELSLRIADNGCGMAGGQMKEGFGTRHIKERISMLNGTVSFRSEEGFCVEAVIPIRWGEEYD